MNKLFRNKFFLLIYIFILIKFVSKEITAEYFPIRDTPPEPLREFRAAWISTVHNIDWPSKVGLSSYAQKSELIHLLELAKSTGLNAVIFQVRTECDAFYDSKIEPWSWFLTGKMGVGPKGYDPLRFIIKEAHRRGIEVHAWFNPFRASATERSIKSKNHITNTHPSLMMKTRTMKWGNPGSVIIRQRALSVIADVVNRYNVDGVHIDDYFYPYPNTINKKVYDSFDDSKTFSQYKIKGGKLEKADWRRENINKFVYNLYTLIKSKKSWVKVGISPFGIWKPGYPSSIKAGLDAYNHIYADSRKWLKRGWLDYMSPQLYWRIQPPKQSFIVLHNWWINQNTKKRFLWPGIASNRILSPEDKGRPASEITNQILITRNHNPLYPGHVHWSIGAIKSNRGGLRSHLQYMYNEVAIPPSFSWLGYKPPDPVYVAPIINSRKLTLNFKNTVRGKWKLIQVFFNQNWHTLRLIPSYRESFTFDFLPEKVSIRNLSATGSLSIPTVLGIH